MRAFGNTTYLFIGLAIGLVAGWGLRAVTTSPPSSATVGSVVHTLESADDVTPSEAHGAAGTALQAIGPDREGTDPQNSVSRGVFEFHHQFESSNGATWFFGTLTNTGPVPSKFKVNAILRAAAGEEVGVAVGYPRPSVLQPGERTALGVLRKDGRAFETRDFEVVALETLGPIAVRDGLEVSGWLIDGAPDALSRQVSGKVQNTSDHDMRMVSVHVNAYDADDKVVGITTLYVDGGGLKRGQTARFTGYVYHHAPALRWTQFASGYLE